jgi:hypothetical protein
MSAVPPVAKVAIAALLIASMARAFLGEPASPARPRLGKLAIGVACIVQATAIVSALTAHDMLAGLAAALGVEATCAAAWLGWYDDGPGPDDGPDDDDEVPPFDWDAFDRERRSWDRPTADV